MLNKFRTIDYRWDKANDTMRENIETVSSDERGRKLVVQVLNNGQVEDVTGIGLSLYWETKDGHHDGLDSFDLVDAKQGIYELYFTTGMLSNVGLLESKLHLIDSNVDSEGAITSKPFSIEVYRGINTEAIESEDSFSALTEALVTVVEIESQEDERQDNEKKRQEQEEVRKSQEEARDRGEDERDTNYAEAEKLRDDKFDSREEERFELFGKSEDTRSNIFSQEEDIRKRKYEKAEDNRDNLYGKAEDRRDTKYAPRLDEVEIITNQTNKALRTVEELTNNLKSESGSNSNGHWIKRADGTMECWKTFTVGGTDKGSWGGLYYWSLEPKEWVFPQPFVEMPNISITSEDLQFFWAHSVVTPTRVFGMDGYRGVGGTIATNQVTVKATGRWSKVADGSFFKGADYPSYWESHLSQKINKADNLQSASLDAHSFVFVTDTHMTSNDGYSFSLIRKIVHDLGLQTVINGGDLANNSVGSLKDRTTQQIRTVVDGYTPLYDKIMMTMGNHDDNSISRLWVETIQHTELYKRIFSFMGNTSIYGPTGKYHYRDDVFNKTRYVVLDSIDIPYIKSGTDLKYRGIHTFAYRQEQVDWLINKALRTPRDWSVVVVSHTPPYESNIKGWDAPTNNEEIVRGILQAYKNKASYSASSKSAVPSEMKVNVSADFRTGGGDVIAWLCGHVHHDNVIQLPEGFPLITNLNDGGTRWLDSPKRVSGTLTEQAFDIVTINKDERKIYLTRVGAGSDRVVSF